MGTWCESLGAARAPSHTSTTHMSSASAAESTLCRQNFCDTIESAVNDQINMDLYASYAYQAAARHFERDDVALFGFVAYFQKQSDEERAQAEKFQQYINLRGGRLVLTVTALCLFNHSLHHCT